MEFSSSKVLDEADEVIVVPKATDVKNIVNPEEYIRILDQLESPSQRLLTLFKSTINPRSEPTHEALWIRKMFLTGAAGGLVLGGILLSPNAHSDYQRQHNASVFENKYRGNRHFWDTLITRVLSKGITCAFKTSLLTTSAGIICFGSVTYRNKLYLPDWLVGFTILGSFSRLWIGSRGVIAGGIIGSLAGLIGFSLVKVAELSFGRSVTQIRYLNHTDWLQKRQAKLRKMQLIHESNHMEYISRVARGDE